MIKKQLFIIFSLLFIISLVGCSSTKETGIITKNSLTVSIKNNIQTQTLQPNIPMTIISYTISGIGPNNETFTENTSDSFCEIKDLSIGTWEITVEGYNSEKTKIALGTTSAIIKAGEATQTDVTVTPLTDSGTFSLNLSWPSEEITDPIITASITSSSSEITTDISSKINLLNNTANYTEKLEPGYYKFSLSLNDGETLIWQTQEAMRIVGEQTTSAIYELNVNDLEEPQNNNSESGIQISVTTELNNPINISLYGGKSDLGIKETMTVSASTDQVVDSYQWYLNGQLLNDEIDKEITIGSNLGTGHYKLTCLVKKNNILSSEEFNFSVRQGITGIGEINLASAINDVIWDGTNYWGYRFDTLYKYDSNFNVLEEHNLSLSSNIMGITWDGSNFWILSYSTLYKIDSTYNIVESFEVPLDWVGAIAWDGQHLWIATDNLIVEYDTNLNEIARYTDNIPSIEEMTWVNNNLWIMDRSIYPELYLFDSSLEKVYKYDVYDNIPNKEFQNDVSGLVWDGSNFITFSRSEFKRAYKIYGLQP